MGGHKALGRKLYLSSYRLGSEPDRLLRLVGRPGRAGIILNACDAFDEPRRVWDREAADLRSLGFEPEEVDLRTYFGDAAGLRSRLVAYSLVWVVGGNAFVLARAMTAAGFAEAAGPDLVYAGYSAGACVAGPDLQGIALMDEPDALPEGYSSSMAPRTLGWVPWRVVPHWRSDHPEAPGAEKAVRYLKDARLAYRALHDGEVIVLGENGVERSAGNL